MTDASIQYSEGRWPLVECIRRDREYDEEIDSKIMCYWVHPETLAYTKFVYLHKLNFVYLHKLNFVYFTPICASGFRRCYANLFDVGYLFPLTYAVVLTAEGASKQDIAQIIEATGKTQLSTKCQTMISYSSSSPMSLFLRFDRRVLF